MEISILNAENHKLIFLLTKTRTASFSAYLLLSEIIKVTYLEQNNDYIPNIKRF